MVRERCSQKLARHEYIHPGNVLRPTVSGNVWVRVRVPGYEKARPISPEKLRRLGFLTRSSRMNVWRNVMKHQPSITALSPNRRSTIQPDRFLFPGTVIGNSRYDQIIDNSGHTIRDNLRVRPERMEPFVHGCTVRNYLATSIVMVTGTDCNPADPCEFTDPPTDLARLFHPRFAL